MRYEYLGEQKNGSYSDLGKEEQITFGDEKRINASPNSTW